MVLIYISLTGNDFKQLFICLFTTCMPALTKRLFKSFTYFLIQLFVFLLLSFESSLEILNIGFCQISDLQIFLQSVPYLVIL